MLTAVRGRSFSLHTAGFFYTLSSGDGNTWIILSPPHCPSYLHPTITFFILADHKSGQSIKLLSLFFFSTYILQHTLYHNPSQLLQQAICALAGQARPEAQPTMQLSSVQLVITESSSSRQAKRMAHRCETCCCFTWFTSGQRSPIK